ncbi:MAG: hypothetical protein U9N34_00225 [Candidatus Cloacimonadota bacterium]|nr:hypothetical protein [Candidatus Cloacimonadota bacterium]
MAKNKKINSMCERCQKDCKQSADVIMLGCKNYSPGYIQIPLPFRMPKRKKA